MTIANSNMQWSIACTGDKSVDKVTLDAYLYDDNDIEVILRTIATGAESVLTKTSDYSVAGVPGSTAVVSTTSDYSSSFELHVRRVATLTQTADFVEGDPFPQEVVEQVLDRDTMNMQVINDAMTRAIKFTRSSDESDVEIEDLTASNYLAVNANGDGIIMVPSASTVDAAVADLLSSSGFGTSIYPARIEVTSAGIKLLSGSGTPEASVIASVGSIYLRTAGGAGTSVYFKETGAGNTGWVARNIISADSISVDTVSEKTADNGVTVDSCLIKDGAVNAVIDQGGGVNLGFKRLAIGDWNMDVDQNRLIEHGLTAANIISVTGHIRDDNDTNRYVITQGLVAAPVRPDVAIGKWYSTHIEIVRLTGGTYDNTVFDSTGYNRGYLFVVYSI